MPLKKHQVVCPNPMFLIWLEEWRKEAEERELNSRFTYAKAIASIKKYPLPLRSGQEAKILENVGDATAKRLDQRLKQYLDDGGDPVYLHKVDPVLEAKHKMKENNKEYVCKYRSGPYALILTLYQESIEPSSKGYMLKTELQAKAQPLCDKSFTLPDPGSHYTAWSSMGSLQKKGYITKRSSPAQFTITDAGAELALRLLHGTHELSENTMKNIRKSTSPKKSLAKKTKLSTSNTNNEQNDITCASNLLAELRKNNYQTPNRTKTSSSTNVRSDSSNSRDVINPRLPELNFDDNDDEPRTVVSHQTTKRIIDQNTSAQPSSSKRVSSGISIDLSSDDQLFSVSKKPNLSPAHSASSLKKLLFWYVTDSGSVSVLKSKALVTIDDAINGLGFLIKVKKSDLQKSSVKYKLDDTRKEVDGFVFAYISDTDAPNVTSTPDFESSSKISSSLSFASTSPTIPSIPSHRDFELDEEDELLLPSLDDILKSNSYNSKTKVKNISTKTGFVPTSRKTSSHSNVDVIELTDESYDKIKKKTVDLTQGSYKSSTVSSKQTSDIRVASNPVASKPSGSSNNVISLDDIEENERIDIDEPCSSDSIPESNSAKDVFDTEPLFILKPGSFDILLCVDVIETAGAGKRKKELADKLTNSKVNMNIRKLQLGDFLWVAKEKAGTQRELVLDFIVERKRMDDLASSIVDGRFREQKFRLKNSGLLKQVYLVEKYGSVEHYPVPVATLKQAMTNTQLIDGLFVKETMDIHDSVNYLSLVTAQISSLYTNKTLHAYSMEKVTIFKQDKNHGDLLDRSIQYFSTFEEFSMETNKNKMLTVKELFAKQLMIIKGVSTERALTIIGRYPTPCALVNAYNSLYSQSEKENLLTEITFGKNKRKLGAPLSLQVYLMYSRMKAN